MDPAYQRIRDCKALPSPTGVAMEILRLAGDEDSTLDQLSTVIETDPALASRILKLANSSFVGMPRKVGSAAHAVRLLGLRTVKNMALTLSLVTEYRQGSCVAFDYEAFWSGSLLRAVAMGQITSMLKDYSPEETFTTGLLSGIGQLALATVFPKEYATELSRLESSDPQKLLELERRVFGVDHDQLSAEMMADWHIPDVFCEAVRHQDQPESINRKLNQRSAQLCRLLHLSSGIAAAFSHQQTETEMASSLVREAGKIGISSEAFGPLLESVASEWRKTGEIFSVPTHDADTGVNKLQAAISEAEQGEPKSSPEHGSTAAAHTSGNALRVLVVDDDPACLRILEKYLVDAGYHVLAAENGAQALEIDRAEAPQIVITDLMMPEMDGFEFCRRLRPQDERGFVYVIVLTGDSEKETLIRAFDAGADDFVAKPFGREELLAHIRAAERIVRLESKLAERSREVARYNARLAVINNKLQAAATIDELTGLANRRQAMAHMAEHWSLASRHGIPLSCIMGDVDHFKAINDTYGHATGDLVLKAVAQILRNSSRAGDVVCRLGGEEFLIICLNSTAGSAEGAAERMRQLLSRSPIQCDGANVNVTISFGVAALSIGMKGPDDLVKSADEALYAAKEGGRNRVCVAGEPVAHGFVSPGPAEAGKELASRGTTDSVVPAIKVVVVDDDATAMALTQKVLEQSGCSVFEASNGLDALERVKACSPDVVILDAQMPHINGAECARRLKADPETQGIPIIMLSAAGEPEDIKNGLVAGADDYVVKPFRSAEFVLRVRAMARLYRDKNELIRSNHVRWEQGRVMQLLLELSHDLAGASSMDQILNGIIKATSELTWARRVSIMLPTPQGNSLAIAKSTGIERDIVDSVRVVPGYEIAGHVFSTGDPIIINSPEEMPASATQYESRFYVSAPLISKPLRASERSIGVLNITDRFGQKPFEPHVLESIETICRIGAAAIENFVARQTRDQSRDTLVVALATLTEHRDLDTGLHLERVTRYAVLLAEQLRTEELYSKQIDEAFIQALQRAVPLHDIGKVAVPDHILLKPGKLTNDEFAIMKRHAELGAKTIRSIMERAPDAHFLKTAEEIAHGHHEWYNGNGYPRGLEGDAIPLAARIAAVADVYDALTSKRPYKEPMPPGVAGEIIRNSSGSQFDPAVVEAFVDREREFSEIATRLADDHAGTTEFSYSLVDVAS